jgi:hypothetical protein
MPKRLPGTFTARIEGFRERPRETGQGENLSQLNSIIKIYINQV